MDGSAIRNAHSYLIFLLINIMRKLKYYTFTLVKCDEYNESDEGLEKTCYDLKSFLSRSFNQTSELCECRSASLKENLTQLKNRLQAVSEVLFYPPIIYNNKKYFISNFPHKNVADAMTYCTAFGGYLAEIDDEDENKALQSFLLHSQPDLVVVGGSDAAVEGSWIFPRTGLPVKILDWIPGQPDNLGEEDCLNLWRTNGGKLNDLPCGFRAVDDRFMCEIPIYF